MCDIKIIQKTSSIYNVLKNWYGIFLWDWSFHLHKVLKISKIIENLPSLTPFHENIDIIGCLGEIDEFDNVRMINFLTDLYLRFYSFDNIVT